MTEGYLIGLAKNTLTTSLILVAPILAVSLVVGLSISIFQSMTQIHEMTLTFVPKAAGVVLILLLLGSWMSQHLLQFTTNLLSSIATLAK